MIGKDLIGKKFGRLKVIKQIGVDEKSRQKIWLCKCDCGNLKETKTSYLTSGDTSSCGCYRKECELRNLEEYRELKPYYHTRLKKVFGFDYINKRVEIVFRNGYSYNSPSVRCLCILNIGSGRQEWGAESKKEYYILTILKVLEVKNYER